VALMDLEQSAEALAAFDAVAAAGLRDAELANNRAVALRHLGRQGEALAAIEDALSLEPQLASAWGNRGLVLRDMARFEEALSSFDMVLSLSPGNAAAWNSRGSVLRDMKRDDEAIESFSKAIEARPDYAEALNNRGYTHWSARHDFAAATADLQKALRLDPEHPYALGELLHVKTYGADWSDYGETVTRITDGVRAGKRVARPFMFQSVSESPADLQACSRIWTSNMYPPVPAAPHAPRNGGKIRIGYASGEFRDQATQILMAGIYEKHDREKFELVAIDNGTNDHSPMRARLEKAFDQWIDISALSDEAASARIREAGVDILVNLNGYFGAPRMGVFARKPAPVQVNYLGFPATLGAPYIDYIIADQIVIPEAEKQFYDEQVVWLPGAYQANDDKRAISARTMTRAEAGLPEKGFVFCNFNQSYKLTPDVFAAWMRILKAVDGSVLWLLETRPPFADNIRKAAQGAGIAPERIVIAADMPHDQHLARLKLADLFLDEQPYNAHTTASDALWAGLPLLTCKGHAFPGRVAASLLTAAGLPELITENLAAYEKQAIALANDAKALDALKAKLAANRDTCPLFDTDRTRRHLETAYAQMWAQWQAGKPPAGFAVKADA
jgi:predicted O-linked N-acetylglucosamine transferase (SPINDLY family)